MKEQQGLISPVTIFYSYAHADESLRQQLEKHLSGLRREGLISEWHDLQILAGTDRITEVDQYLNAASVILLLISPDFIASDDCYGTQMQRALDRHRQGEAYVIPIILRPVDLQGTPLAQLQCLPRGNKPITTWANQDEAFELIAQAIRRAVIAIHQQIVIVSSPSDQLFMTRLKNDLAKRGFALWYLDEDSVQDDLLQVEAARRAIRASRAVLLVASPDARSSRIVKAQLQLVSDYQRKIIALWAKGESLNMSIPDEWSGMETLDARNERYERARRDLLVRLRKRVSLDPSATIFLQDLQMPFEPRNPYKGLRAFGSNDARDFFGRNELVRTLLEKMKKTLVQEKQGGPISRMIAVVGPSGSGKSSVVMAGLLPRLYDNALPRSKEWIYLDPIAPGGHPLESLILTLSRHLPERSLSSLREDLTSDSARGLHLLATQIVRSPGTHMILFVDQFEELFTQTADVSERQLFIDLLITSITEPRGPLVVIITLRADFFDRPMQYPVLHRLIEAHQTLVFPMDKPELRAVIEQPASLPDVQLIFEEPLVGDLLFEMSGQIGALPLLQFTLDQLYQRRNGHLLTLKAYQEIGGVKGALAEYAERTYLGLPSNEHKLMARVLFVRLIDLGTAEQDIRRRAFRSEFIFNDDTETRILQETIDAFITARLLIASETGGKPIVELSHEALIREWRRLFRWLLDARKDNSLQQTISRDATEWEQQQQSKDRLYRGSHLKEAKSWITHNVANKNETAFIQASIKHQRNGRIRLLLLLMLILGFVGVLAFRLIQAEVPPPALTITPANLTSTSSNCSVVATIAQCTVTLYETKGSSGIVHWKASTDISDAVAFNPASGDLSPGESNTITISAIPCQNGSFTFSDSRNTSFTSVLWHCTPSPTTSKVTLLKRQRFSLPIDYKGLLSNSPSAINGLEQRIKDESSLQGHSVDLAIIYGGALASTDVAQAYSIVDKVRSVLEILGQQGFAFQKSSYYDDLFILGGDPSVVILDLYLPQ